MSDPLSVLRSSHNRLVALLRPLDESGVTAPSYDAEWTIADVASHLGSQAEIFTPIIDAGVAGKEPAGPEAFPAIWDRWNATAPADQVRDSIDANEAFVSRVEGLGDDERAAFRVALFGRDFDLDAFLAMRLTEHVLHTWDVAVALDPSASLPDDEAAVLLSQVGPLLERVQRPVEGAAAVRVSTVGPESVWDFDLANGGLADTASKAQVSMPAEAFLRMISGRLDADHTPAAVSGAPEVLDALRAAFPGY